MLLEMHSYKCSPDEKAEWCHPLGKYPEQLSTIEQQENIPSDAIR